MVCSCVCLALFTNSGDKTGRSIRREQVAAREQAEPLEPSCTSASRSLELLPEAQAGVAAVPSGVSPEDVVQLECEAEELLAISKCGSLVILGSITAAGSGGGESPGGNSQSDSPGPSWRMQEILGSCATTGAVPSSARPVKAKKRSDNCEDGWRWEEMCGSASAPITASEIPCKPAKGLARGEATDGPVHTKRNRKRSRGGKKKGSKRPLVQQMPVEAAAEYDECGWRWEEMCGATRSQSPHPRAKPVRPSKPHDLEESWRWQEVNFTTHDPEASAPSIAASSAVSKASCTALCADAVHTVSNTASLGTPDIRFESSGVSNLAAVAALELGDLVRLGPGAPAEYRDCRAVLVKVFASHCTVVVLDEEGRFGVGECWPNFEDVILDSCMLRLGTRVVIDGMRGKRTQSFNGSSGRISRHPREGHPVLIRKPSSPDQPQITVCVSFDNPRETGEKSALIEPRFLLLYDEAVRRIAQSLGDTAACLSARSEP